MIRRSAHLSHRLLPRTPESLCYMVCPPLIQHFSKAPKMKEVSHAISPCPLTLILAASHALATVGGRRRLQHRQWAMTNMFFFYH